MTTLTFPPGFLWGTATAAHQVEGDNTNSDWWDWERRADTPVTEPSGSAIDHLHRYDADLGLLAGLGFGVYRFSVEWARIEPERGSFDEAWLGHYRDVIGAVRTRGMTPMVTLNHFTLPRWVAQDGGWMNKETPELFERYCRKVATAFGDAVDWYCTINEPGMVAFGGYLGALGWPPGATSMDSWHLAINGLRKGHVLARDAIKDARPTASVGATHAMNEWESNSAGRPLVDYLRKFNEDVYLEVCEEDDFIGVQTYTRVAVNLPGFLAPLTRAVAGWGAFRRSTLPRLVRSQTRTMGRAHNQNQTDMGYEYRPQAVAATVRRAAAMFPGKRIIVTEHGIATTDDTRRIAFIREGLTALHRVVEDGVPLAGYIHWSAFDNFEWALGYGMRFGLIGVDRSTQQRTPKPSAEFLGAIARSGTLPV